MDIRLVDGKYKSISALIWQNIPSLAVITGANGSGKTQLLELSPVQPVSLFLRRGQACDIWTSNLSPQS